MISTLQQTNGPTTNILKVREDTDPVEFSLDESGAQRDSESVPGWAEECLDRPQLRSRIEPWLTSLVQADHLNLLVGSGLTTGMQHLARADAPKSMDAGQFSTHQEAISRASKASAKAARRGTPNRSEEHTSELQSRFDLVCRLLLEKKKINIK